MEQIAEQDNQLIVNVAPEVDVMLTDVAKVRKVLVHLLGNAAKFTVGGDVKLDITQIMRDEVKYIRFVVSDTGVGMNPDQVERIFDPFTQEDESLTRSFEGTGLGLYISSQFVTKMMGEISVLRSEPGVGTDFEVILPKEIVLS